MSIKINLSDQVEDPSREVERALDEPIDDIVVDHLKACYYASNGQFAIAYEHQVSLGKSTALFQMLRHF